MNITIEAPAVAQCSIDDCSYNNEHQCHARAITVGDGFTPHCDTLFYGPQSVKEGAILAGVGACKVSDCSYNKDLECSADSIQVGVDGNEVKCMTYSTH